MVSNDMVNIVNSPDGSETITTPGSSGRTNDSKRIVVVMDGLKEFEMEPLQWVLKNVHPLNVPCFITLLGVMPWLNIPLSAKTWSDIWTMELENLSVVKEKSEWKNDVKHQKLENVIDICQHYGVVAEVKSEMGYPTELLAVEQIISLNANLVVFDRHHHKYREYYMKKLSCEIVMMNKDGVAPEIIRGRAKPN